MGKNRIKSFTDLKVWQEGHDLVVLVYRETETFPKKEVFGLVSQMRRSAASVTASLQKDLGGKDTKIKSVFITLPKARLLNLRINFLLLSM